MIRHLFGFLRWLFWSLVGGGWCLKCRARLWTGPRSKDWFPPIFCPKCHAVLRFHRGMRPHHFTTAAAPGPTPSGQEGP